jgi:hypothetical protein
MERTLGRQVGLPSFGRLDRTGHGPRSPAQDDGRENLVAFFAILCEWAHHAGPPEAATVEERPTRAALVPEGHPA